MDKEKIFFFAIGVVYILYSIYSIIVQYRERKKVIIKAKYKKITIVKIVILILAFSFCTYLYMNGFWSTKSFREKYSIGFYEIINDEKMESIVKNSGDYDDVFVKYRLIQIRMARQSILMYLIVILLCFIELSISRIRFEHGGIRNLNMLTPWEKYERYVWEENEIIFLDSKGGRTDIYEVKFDEKSILDNYLKENTDIIENRDS